MTDWTARDETLVEEMDRLDCDVGKLLRTHRQLGVVNRLVGGWRRLYRRELLPTAKAGESLRILDVGCGTGHLLRLLGDWARDDGIGVELVGIDLDDRAFAVAVEGVELRRQPLEALAESGERFDWVVCNHVLHHLPTAAIDDFLTAMALVAKRRAVVNDLLRSPWAYYLFPFVGGWFRGGWILVDGQRSIRKSFRPEELRAVVPAGWEMRTMMPWRLVATHGG